MEAMSSRMDAARPAAGSPAAQRSPAEKIYTPAGLREWVREQRGSGLTVGFTCGAFDLLHAGHIGYLWGAKARCDRLIVAVNSDESVRSYKSRSRPIQPEQHRLILVAALECVDAVVLLEDTRPLALLRDLRPDYYFKGGDYERSNLKSARFVESYGGSVVVVPTQYSTSTSGLIEHVRTALAHEEPPQTPTRPRTSKLVFLDRDGTLVRDVAYLHEPELVELLPGAGEGLRQLQELGFLPVLVTNQQGIGLGYFTARDFMLTNQALFRALAEFEVRVARVYYCPHSLSDQCPCRKPSPALFERALEYFGAEASQCYAIGDQEADAEAGRRLGIPTVLVGARRSAAATYTAGDFAQAVSWIARREGTNLAPAEAVEGPEESRTRVGS
jgi:D-glycero-D-manno-heptose 1,7-bisphosphate phosphatase